MSGDRKNIPTYSATDIQKYLKGELSAREMHELEKAALEDPFLADALEGIGQYQAHMDASSEWIGQSRRLANFPRLVSSPRQVNSRGRVSCRR